MPKVRKNQLMKDLDRPSGTPPPVYGILPPDWEATAPDNKVDGKVEATDPFAVLADAHAEDSQRSGGAGSKRLSVESGPWANVGRRSFESRVAAAAADSAAASAADGAGNAAFADADADADDVLGLHGSDGISGVGSQAVRAAAALQSSVNAGERSPKRTLPTPPAPKPPRLSKEKAKLRKDYTAPQDHAGTASVGHDAGVEGDACSSPSTPAAGTAKKVPRWKSKPEIMTMPTMGNKGHKGETIPSLLSSHLLAAGDEDAVTAVTPEMAPTPSPPPSVRAATPPRSTITPKIVAPKALSAVGADGRDAAAAPPAPPLPSLIVKSHPIATTTPAAAALRTARSPARSPLLTKSGKAPRKATPPRPAATPKESAPKSNLSNAATETAVVRSLPLPPLPPPPSSVPSLATPTSLNRPASVDSFVRNEEMMQAEAAADVESGSREDGGGQLALLPGQVDSSSLPVEFEDSEI